MTLSQVYWAMSHDWYFYTGTETSTGTRVVHVHDGKSGDVLEFTDYQKLRTWAGY